MVGGGTAALTGLVFVAMSLNLDIITEDATHRYRAIGTLSGFTGAFIICAFGLFGGQDNRALGVEWLVVAAIAAFIYVDGYFKAIREGGSRRSLLPLRVVAGAACYGAQIVGAVLLTLGFVAGLYVASIAMVVFFASLISGAWLLIVGVARDQRRGKERDRRD